MTANQDKMLCKMEQAAAVLDIGITKLKELLRSGEIHSIRIGRSRRITRSSLQAYIDRQDVMQNGSTS